MLAADIPIHAGVLRELGHTTAVTLQSPKANVVLCAACVNTVGVIAEVATVPPSQRCLHLVQTSRDQVGSRYRAPSLTKVPLDPSLSSQGIIPEGWVARWWRSCVYTSPSWCQLTRGSSQRVRWHVSDLLMFTSRNKVGVQLLIRGASQRVRWHVSDLLMFASRDQVGVQRVRWHVCDLLVFTSPSWCTAHYGSRYRASVTHKGAS